MTDYVHLPVVEVPVYVQSNRFCYGLFIETSQCLMYVVINSNREFRKFFQRVLKTCRATGARRRYYSLTEPGREKLAEDKSAWEETRSVMDELIINS